MRGASQELQPLLLTRPGAKARDGSSDLAFALVPWDPLLLATEAG